MVFSPGPRTVILGPNNAGKSTVLEHGQLDTSDGSRRTSFAGRTAQ
jgi:ABC-type hemin transport system ATPase subunit